MVAAAAVVVVVVAGAVVVGMGSEEQHLQGGEAGLDDQKIAQRVHEIRLHTSYR